MQAARRATTRTKSWRSALLVYTLLTVFVGTTALPRGDPNGLRRAWGGRAPVLQRALRLSGGRGRTATRAYSPVHENFRRSNSWNWLVHGKGSGAQARKVVLAVSFYFLTSLSLTFMNKCIFRQFPFPLFVTAFQLVIAWIMLWVFGWAGQHWKPLAFAPPAEFNPSVAAAVSPAPLNPRVTNKASGTPRDAKA